jgi:tetratricopeptide (TPR) repeat protein
MCLQKPSLTGNFAHQHQPIRMNKAAFLNIIRQVAPIQDQEVEDLEELVASFPYCQTAHILLAKAAYDRGSMLSTQKLRRAAAHASNRQLLKRIVYAPPILPTTVEVLEEEAPAVFAPIPENEAKIAFPEVAPEGGILQALENLSEEDLLDTEVEIPNEIEEPEEDDHTSEQPIQEPSSDEDQDDAPIEEPAQEIEDAFAFEEEFADTDDIQVEEHEPAELLEAYLEEVENTEEAIAMPSSDEPVEEAEPEFFEDLLLEASPTSSEGATIALSVHSTEQFETTDNHPEWQENESEHAQFIDVEDAFASVIEGSQKDDNLIADAAIEESVAFNAEEELLESDLSSAEVVDESVATINSQENEEAVFEAEIEADFITNAVQQLTSTSSTSKKPFEDNVLEVAQEEDPFVESEPAIAQSFFNESFEERDFENILQAELLPEEPTVIDKEDVTTSINTHLPEVATGVEEDELFSLVQIDGLATLTAPIPSVNLSHAEIISELTSKPEPLEFLAEEEPITEELTEVAATYDEPVTVSPELIGFVAGLQGVQAEDERILDGEQGSFPMLQMAPVATGTPEVETEKDPYLSIFYHNSLAYWMDSSRMGETIQLRDELTTSKPYYFQPDLILEHVKGNGAMEQVVKPVAKLDVQLGIIDQFLKSNPKLKSMAHLQQKSEPQEDLSAKSSKIKKNLASENLALIFIKQGKHKKALKIYEQLIVKFPEKKSYFAEQIEKLRNEL